MAAVLMGGHFDWIRSAPGQRRPIAEVESDLVAQGFLSAEQTCSSDATILRPGIFSGSWTLPLREVRYP